MTIDFQNVMKKAEEYKPQISAFLRDMIAIPSESCDEKKVVQRIKQEMEAVGFDRVVDKWTFSTNGVSIMGRYGIPCIGFGPGAENQAHAPNEITWKKELVKAAAMYAVIPWMDVDKYAQ